MDELYIDDEISDDEVYIGKLTIKEIKKMLCRQEEPSKTLEEMSNTPNTSLRLIETHSQPNLRHGIADSPSTPSPHQNRNSDESFIEMENVVSKLCLSPRNSDNVELNNTLEVIDYILNHGANHQGNKNGIDEAKPKESPPLELSPVKKAQKITEKTEQSSPNYYTPAKNDIKPFNFSNQNTPQFKTPICHPLDLKNPSSSNVKKVALFKTPTPRSAVKKPSTPQNTPGRSNAYNHISSPIATYIKNSPQVPLVRDVHPKKPLPGVSSIPKLVKKSEKAQVNKENVNLPSVAYKNAKKTKVVHLPDVNKLPQSQWAKKITSSLPTVMKHENRKNMSDKKPFSSLEDTLANLSCHQAEVSLCTQKTAFKSTNKY